MSYDRGCFYCEGCAVCGGSVIEAFEAGREEEAALAHEYREKYKAYEQQNYVLHEDLYKATGRVALLEGLLREARKACSDLAYEFGDTADAALVARIDSALAADAKGVGDGE